MIKEHNKNATEINLTLKFDALREDKKNL